MKNSVTSSWKTLIMRSSVQDMNILNSVLKLTIE